MASVFLTHTWADGSIDEFQVHLEESFPDSAAEAVAGVLRMYRAVCTEDASDER